MTKGYTKGRPKQATFYDLDDDELHHPEIQATSVIRAGQPTDPDAPMIGALCHRHWHWCNHQARCNIRIITSFILGSVEVSPIWHKRRCWTRAFYLLHLLRLSLYLSLSLSLQYCKLSPDLVFKISRRRNGQCSRLSVRVYLRWRDSHQQIPTLCFRFPMTRIKEDGMSQIYPNLSPQKIEPFPCFPAQYWFKTDFKHVVV